MAENAKIVINMLSEANSVPGQGVGSAFLEQVALVKDSPLLEVVVNSKKQSDILHIHSINLRYFFRYTRKIPSIAYCHFLPSTLDTSIHLPWFFMLPFKWYIIQFYKRANYLVVVNPSFIEPLKKIGIKEERIKYIPNYVDQKVFHKLKNREKLRQQYGVSGFTVLGVGQIQTRKGVADFIEVAKKLPEISFIWAGGFSFKGISAGYTELKQLVDNPPGNVRFLGIVEREKMNEIYNLADVMFLPSLSELFPMSILETGQLEIPFVVRDLSLYQPIFFDTKYLRGQSVLDFVSIIKRLQTDSEFYQEGVTASKWVKSFYNKAHVLKIWEDFYSQVAASKKKK